MNGQVIDAKTGKWRPMTTRDLIPDDYLVSLEEVRRDAIHEQRELEREQKK